MSKNTDPRTLDQTNVGDAAVWVRQDGSSQSVIITKVEQTRARLVWKLSPNTTRGMWISAFSWSNLTLFPAGCKFLAV